MNHKNFNKKTITSFLLAATMLLSITSCKKDNTTSTSTAPSDDEVAEAVTETASGSSGGLATQTETTAVIASTDAQVCGETGDTTITGQNLAGAAITYSYTLASNHQVICDNGIPSEFDFNFTGKSNYTALHMSSNDSSEAHFIVTGLQPSSTNYILNESYVRNGTQQSSVRLQRSISSTITLTSTNVTVDKTTQKIISGTATAQFAGAVTGGASVSRGATVTFLGGGKATLVLDNGGSYSIQW